MDALNLPGHLFRVHSDENDICNYLKQWPKKFTSGKEIGRWAAGKHRYREDPYWAVQPLSRLVEKQIIETDCNDYYRMIQKEKKKVKKWISPELQKILEQSGKEFDGVIDKPEPEDPKQ